MGFCNCTFLVLHCEYILEPVLSYSYLSEELESELLPLPETFFFFTHVSVLLIVCTLATSENNLFDIDIHKLTIAALF